ncbi:hypothetical protein Bca52824_058314 [Brassica carinata]|uniref:Uncharacterized protein n=1 Tax=Brassica carinata TaxID=52824 RepID=A0A8X7UEL2_BRACI|nr:hypothetical protein Bca52824_058314 [Brassica carinata]
MEEEGKQITCLIVCGCGGNRSLFETSSPTLSKKLCSFSPSRFSSSLLLDHLAAIFSDMDTHLRLKFTDQKPELSLVQEEANVVGGGGSSGKEEVLNLDGTEWVDLFDREMKNASDMKVAGPLQEPWKLWRSPSRLVFVLTQRCKAVSNMRT